MKKENGITLISLILYVILLTIIVGGVANITSSFYANLNEYDKESEHATAYSKVNMYILKDVKRDGATITHVSSNSIELNYGSTEYNPELVTVLYTIENKSLYRSILTEGKKNKVRICDGIDKYEISQDMTGKYKKFKITLVMGEYKKTTTYVLENYSHGTNDVETV